ncbi:MAG: cell wall hydrolase [Clostridia bacterium]|nr:cell wall hydrolase [Clostridia bacterium]
MIAIIIIVLATKYSTVDDGKYKEGDLSNVPYVISSMVMDKLVIVNDSTGNYTYAFQNKEGKIVTLDESLDEALETLRENGSTSINLLGEDSLDTEKKELLKKMLQAEIATQYPDLTLNEDLGLASSSMLSGGGNQLFLQKAEEIKRKIAEEGYTYSFADPRNSKGICCASYVSWALQEAGYDFLEGSVLINGAVRLSRRCEQHGFERVYYGKTLSVEEAGLQPGDIVVEGSGPTDDEITHVQIYVGKNSEGANVWYNAGSSDPGANSIGTMPGEDTFSNPRANDHYIVWVYRVPQIGSGSTNSSTVDRTVTDNSAAEVDGVNDYCVKIDEPDSMPVLNEAQLLEIVEKSNRSEEAKATMREVMPSIVKAQEKYKVNAVFCLAVTLQESGWGTGWDLIDKSTYNWTSVKTTGSNGYRDRKGQMWQIYESWEDCTNSWFELIAENKNYYFSQGDYTCNSIGEHYCTEPPNWGGAVSKHIETFYGYLGITPNVVGVDAGNAVYANSNTMQEDTGDIKTDQEIKNEDTVQGGIKLQRKDEDGNVIDLTYTSTKNFKALVSQNSEDALKYYTIVKTSGSSNKSNSNTQSSGSAAWGVTISYENWSAYRYAIGAEDVSYDDMFVKGYITQDRKKYIVTTTGGYRYAGPGVQLESNVDLFAEEGIDINSQPVGSEIDCEIVHRVSQKALSNVAEYVKKDAESHGVTLNENQILAVADVYYMWGPWSPHSQAFWSAYATYGDSDELGKIYSEFYYLPENSTSEDLANLNNHNNSRCASRWMMFKYGKYVSSAKTYKPEDFTQISTTSNNNSNKKNNSSDKTSDNKNNTKTNSTKDSKDKTNNTSDSSTKTSVTSLDNFLFIGDSRYHGIENNLTALGTNITAIGVGSSFASEWVNVTKNGSGTVKGESVTLPTSAAGISVLLGTNGAGSDSEINSLKEVLNNLHERYPNTPIFANSLYQISTAYGPSYSAQGLNVTNEGMKAAIEKVNQALKDFCNQNNSWAYYVDITKDLEGEDGYLKYEYSPSNDGLHITGSEGVEILVNNIKNGILNADATSTDNSENNNSRPGFSIIVANRTDTNMLVTDTYEYAESFAIEKANGHRINGVNQSTDTPADQIVRSTSSTRYSLQNVDYQTALQNFTLYFDFLWAILADSHNQKMVTKWAELVCDNIGENSKVVITVYNDTSTSQSLSSQNKGTITKVTSSEDGDLAYHDVYSIIETTTTMTVKLISKACITNADTWLINYKNEAESYSKYKSKSEEKILEKTNLKSDDPNIIKILKKYEGTLKTLTKEEYIVDEMLEDNEKVSFMIDVYSYILDVANGKEKDEIDIKLDSLLDTSLFDLSKTEEVKVTRVLLYDSLNINDETLQLLYKAVEKICEPYGDDDDNTKRKKYVTSVILNRAMSSEFPSSVKEVLTQKYQFENYNPKVLKENITISDSTKEAVDTIVVAGDCAKHSVYFAKPSTAEKNKWDEKFTFTFNDGDETDNSFNYYTTDEVDSELKKYEITIKGRLTRPSIKGRKIIKWAKGHVGSSKFDNKYENKTMNSSNSSPEFIKSAYYAGGLEYISGDIPCPNEIEYYEDGTVDYSKIPETAVIVADNGIASLYIGDGYVIEAGGAKIQKVPIDESQGAGHFKGWGFAAEDQDAARDELVVVVGAGNYAQGWTPLEDYSEGYSGIYTCGDKSYKTYMQGGSAPWAYEPFSESGSYAEAACGVTTVATILTGYGVDVTPYDVGTYAYSVVGAPVGSTTTAVTGYYAMTECFKHWGITDQSGFISPNYNDIKDHLKEGKPVMLLVRGNYGPRTTGGHYISLLGYDDLNDKVLLGDAASGGRNSGWWDLDSIYPAIVGVNYIND